MTTVGLVNVWVMYEINLPVQSHCSVQFILNYGLKIHIVDYVRVDTLEIEKVCLTTAMEIKTVMYI